MSAKIPVCILGATGTVGQKFVRLLWGRPPRQSTPLSLGGRMWLYML